MKKLISLWVACGLLVSLAGCSGSAIPLTNNQGSSSSSSSEPQSASSGSVSTPAGAGEAYPDSDGYADGYLGTVMHTYFFDFTVNSGYLCGEFGGYTPAEGNQLLVTEVTVKNTDTSTIPMFDTDFQAQWNEDEDEDAFSMPIAEVVSDQQLPDEYELRVQESRTGLLIFEVPEGYKDFSVSYMEYFSDDSTGDLFFVYFTADQAPGTAGGTSSASV